jgi:hypothetical protein
MQESPANMLLAMGLLSALCVALGLGASLVMETWLAPETLRGAGLAVPSLSGAPAGLSFVTGNLNPLWAALLIGLALLCGLVFYALGGAFKVRRVRSFIGAETKVPAPTYLSGTGFYLTVRNLPGLRVLYSDAEREAFDPYRLVGQYGQIIVEWLRRLHTGILETYVTWVLAGAAIAMAIIFLLKK